MLIFDTALGLFAGVPPSVPTAGPLSGLPLQLEGDVIKEKGSYVELLLFRKRERARAF